MILCSTASYIEGFNCLSSSRASGAKGRLSAYVRTASPMPFTGGLSISLRLLKKRGAGGTASCHGFRGSAPKPYAAALAPRISQALLPGDGGQSEFFRQSGVLEAKPCVETLFLRTSGALFAGAHSPKSGFFDRLSVRLAAIFSAEGLAECFRQSPKRPPAWQSQAIRM